MSRSSKLVKFVTSYGAPIALLLWSGGTLFVDLRVGLALANQMITIGYRPARALVMESGVQRESNSSTYRPKVHYEYKVDGERYEGTELRRNVWAMNDHTANRMANAYPEGSSAQVYYDPSRPEVSVLRTGIGGMDLLQFMLVVPLNAVMVCGWLILWRVRRRQTEGPPGLPIRETGSITRIFILRRSAVVAGGIILLCGCLLGYFPVALLVGFDPSVQLMSGIWLFVIALTVLVFAYTIIGNWSDARCIAIDRREQRITMPGRYESQDLEGLMDVSVTASKEPTVTGEALRFLLHFHFRDEVQREPIALPFRDPEQADGFLKWFKNKLGLK